MIEQVEKIIELVSQNAMHGLEVEVECKSNKGKENVVNEGKDQAHQDPFEVVKVNLIKRTSLNREVVLGILCKVGGWFVSMAPYVTIIWLAYIAKWIVEILTRG